ncbi:DUF1877 family protein [Micromonospora sp. C81]|uniref:DUF1877 family protein n=1 Tax=Micromonospora sp. C81 TaxID=2824881 RepID=UPI0027DFC8C6|nr:DUF1877 family protein [Micromonospora sp. C81]
MLGDLARLSIDELEEIRRLRVADAYDRLADFDPVRRLDLDRDWRRLAALMDAAGFPINPITGGSLFPDERRAWGDEIRSRHLNVDEVAQGAEHLNRVSFDLLAPHMRSVLEAEGGQHVDLDPSSPDHLKAIALSEQGRIAIPDEVVHDATQVVGERYHRLVAFFDAAARHNQCTVFWAG